jgi:hypothetical protein
MPRFARNMTILAKAEGTYATDPTPTAAANAILISNPDVKAIKPKNVDRDLVRQYFGASEQLVGTKTVEMSFDVELVGSGSAGDPPAWDPLIEACAMVGEADTGVRYDYLPVTDNQASVTIWIYDSGVLHKLVGGRGNAKIKLKEGEKPIISFTFEGLYGAISAATPDAADYSMWMVPQVPTNANTASIKLGSTFAATGAPALTGGTAIPSLGIEVDLGNTVAHTPLIGGETVDVTDREVLGKLMLDLTAAQEVTRMGDVLLATLSSVGILHGTVVGNKVGLFLPSVQFINPTKGELNGRRLIEYDIVGVPDPAGEGNDEIRLVTSF